MRNVVTVALVLLCGAAWAETYQAHCKSAGAIIVAESEKPRVVRIRHTGPPETEIAICETAVGPACVPEAGIRVHVGEPAFEIRTAKPLSCVKMGPAKDVDAIAGVVIEEP